MWVLPYAKMRLMVKILGLRKRDRSSESLTREGTFLRDVGCANQSQAAP
jgi:hypothetical protein